MLRIALLVKSAVSHIQDVLNVEDGNLPERNGLVKQIKEKY